MSKNINILVVDDNHINRQYFSMAIKKFGFEVSLAHDGFEAIELARAIPFDLIFMDIRMPEIGGDETATIIKTIHLNQDTPILAISAEEIPDEIQSIFNGFILKPASPKQLKHNIEMFCQPKNPTVAVFDRKQALKYAYNDSEIMQKLIKMFIKDLPTQMNLLEQSLLDTNIIESKNIIHKLRGSCKSCGAMAFDEDLKILAKTINKNLDVSSTIDKIRQSASHYIKNVA